MFSLLCGRAGRRRPGADRHSGEPEIDWDGATKRMGANRHLPIRALGSTGWTVGAA